MNLKGVGGRGGGGGLRAFIKKSKPRVKRF